MDTRDKRASAIGLIYGLALVLPNPDGLAFSQGDRMQVAFSYRGIATAAAEPADGEIVYVEAVDRTVLVAAVDHTISVEFNDRTILAEPRPTP